MQEDPHPGKLSIPGTVVNKYAYAGNSPTNFIDPTGKFISIIAALAIVAATGVATAGAVANYNSARASGKSVEDARMAALIGGLFGFVGTFFSVLFPAAAPFIIGGTSALNNLTNQLVFGDGNIDWGRVFLAGLIGGASTFFLGKLFNKIPGVQRVFELEGQSALSSLFGTTTANCIDSGVDPKQITIYCGVTTPVDEPRDAPVLGPVPF